MRSPGTQIAAISTVLAVAVSAPLAAQQTQSEATQAFGSAVVESPNDQDYVTIENADGSTLVGGHLGRIPDACSVGPRAFVKMVDADGAVLWQREQAGAAPLFQGSTTFQSDLVTMSSVYGIARDAPTGQIAVTGEAVVQSLDGTSSIVGFVLLLDDSDGSLVADQSIGVLPTGPSPQDGCCEAVCDDGGGGPGGDDSWCHARGVDLVPGVGVAVTGSCDARDDEESWGKDLFVALYTDDLSSRLWKFQVETAGDDEGLGVAIDAASGLVAVGGYFGQGDADAFAATFDLQGNLLDIFTGGGDFEDQGQDVSFDTSGNIVLTGRFTETGTFGDDTLGGPGECQQGFRAVLDAQTLEAETVEETSPQGLALNQAHPFDGGDASYVASSKARGIQNPAPPEEPAPPENPLILSGYTLLLGFWQTGCLEDLQNSDNLYLNIMEGIDSNGHAAIELLFHYDIDPAVEPTDFIPTELSVELKADTCYTATLWVDGLVDDVLHELGTMQVCPGTEPVLTAPISAELAQQLGFGSGAAASAPGAQLEAKLKIDFGEDCPAPPGAMCSSPGEDASIDTADVETDYGV